MESSVIGVSGKKSLRLVEHAVNVDAELAKFESEERIRLGLDKSVEHWVEDMANLTFTKTEKSRITLLVGGLTLAHDYLVEGALKGIGYNVQMLDVPDNDAFRFGKEFGNRGQCNPTYFTVGNLVKILCTLRDKHGLSSEYIVQNYVFLTAGACGPCRFGMYVTEYRKALRDAGFEGFRVVLFQQKGGMKQATGEASGLELTPQFFWSLTKALVTGDVLNALGYRIRPYEVEPGATDRALEKCKKTVYDALQNGTMIMPALWACKPHLESIKVDRLVAKPKISIIGEFWAMTTEGDGNYGLQRFLESEGAEDDIQLVVAWILYSIWEGKFDTSERENLRGQDKSYYGLAGIGPWGLAQRKVGYWAADKALRALFQTFAHTLGLYGYQLPDMGKIAEVSHAYYNNDLRGGEGHMEVGKLILNTIGKKAHMTLSVKPFGCMPSAGVSDGVQSAITEKFPGTIYCPVETSGDGRVNFYSRVQMYLFKAKQAANAEFEQALADHGVTLDQVKAFVTAHPRFGSALYKAPHTYSGTAADIIAEVAPLITMTRRERVQKSAKKTLSRVVEALRATPSRAKELAIATKAHAPGVVSRIKEDVAVYMETRKGGDAGLAAAAE